MTARDANNKLLRVGNKVAPAGTPCGVTYGYVRAIFDGDRAPVASVSVYWPEIKSCGTWPADALVK